MTHATDTAASPTRRRRWLWVGLVVVLALVAAAVWLAVRASQAQGVAADLSSTVDRLQASLDDGDLTAVAADLTTLQAQAADLHAITGDPLWAVAAHLPVVGSRAQAARTLGEAADRLATPATDLAALLPAFSTEAIAAAGGALPVDEIAEAGPILDALASAAQVSLRDVAALTTDGLTPSQAAQVEQARGILEKAAPALDSAARAAPLAARMLGSEGPRTWFVALQNLAEARGTGGLVGAYAIVTVDQGTLSLESAAPRKSLDQGPVIPTVNLPREFRELWGSDAQEWAGLNLSPHFPYTGQLIDNGWRARDGQKLDGVVAIDQNVVAALLAGTGPVTVSGVTVSADNAYDFLTRGVYEQFPDVPDKDAVVVGLVQQVFSQLKTGDVDPVALAKALVEPASSGSLLVWSADAAEETALGDSAVAGVLPDTTGPSVRAVINNGAGNKLDAYLATSVTYYQGTCTDGTRSGSAVVTLTNKAPRSGLPAYVYGRNDLPAAQRASAPQGSTKALLYVYGPVGADIALATLDDEPVAVPVGVERGHPVWRVDVVLDPGQTRRVEVQFLDYVDQTADTAAPSVTPQVMAVPPTVKAVPGEGCTSS